MSEIPWPLMTQPLVAQAPPKVEKDGAPLERSSSPSVVPPKVEQDHDPFERLLAAESAIEASRDEITAASSVVEVETAALTARKNFKEWLRSLEDLPVHPSP